MRFLIRRGGASYDARRIPRRARLQPDQAEYAVSLPESCHVCWCGDTWRAFLDFTANLAESTEWWVLACDLGVGVVRAPLQERRFGRRRRGSRFTAIVPDTTLEEKWSWLEARRDEALRLVSVDRWYERQAELQAC